MLEAWVYGDGTDPVIDAWLDPLWEQNPDAWYAALTDLFSIPSYTREA